MLIVSLHCDLEETHEAVEAIYLLTPDVCVCVGYPQLSAHPHFKHMQTKRTHQMLECRYKDTHRCLHTNTCS